MKKLLLALLFFASPVFAQTQTQYYTVPTIAALKAMTTSRPAVVQVVDANPGIFNLSAGACSAADDIFQVQPTSGTTVCYTRMATKYSIGSTPLPGANGGTGVANTGKTITLGGNLTTTGAFNATFAIPGTGTWTFPVAGSSLAPLVSPSFTTPSLGAASGTSLSLGAPTGGDKGSGTLNLASYLYQNGQTTVADLPTFKSFFLGVYTTPSLTSSSVGGYAECAGQYGKFNLGIGQTALASMTNGCLNVAIGQDALALAVHEALSTAVGHQALKKSNAEGENSAFGYGALGENLTGIYNTGLGSVALQNNTSGSQNIAVGSHAMLANTTGGGNTGVGYNALSDNLIGASNVAVGAIALTLSKSDNNVAVGYDSLSAQTTAVGQTAVGYKALKGSNGDNNVAVGFQASTAVSTAIRTTAVGAIALAANTAANTTGVGYSALNSNVSGTGNTAVGSFALNAATGSGNTAVGMQAGQGSSLSATGLTIVGSQAGQSLTGAANYNALFGYQSGFGITSGTQNTLVGASQNSGSYSQVTTGSQNISIGFNVAVPTATASGQLSIGNFIYGTGLTGQTTTISTGKIGIGVKAPATALEVVGTITTTNITATALANTATTSAVCYNTGTGVFTYNSTVGTCTVSALRYKTPGKDITSDVAFMGLSGLRTQSWTYKKMDGLDVRERVGLYADDVAKMDSRCATYNDKKEVENYDDRCILAYAVAAIKTLKVANDNMNTEINTLKKVVK
ncbi:hypothetical protein UFOVP1413_51 [uncultured Caudovirales phage]|uniref:Peptidase S74 domain-containing protein n=2 Tax=root TaxID=1 RepID=A0A6J5SAZ0_9CAUD|nr:hypothetical protein UFOVP893_53 [uncultured Caudovirales phage]CAB4210810.1 hypothetical protein UFOVP1413_51 [uncultured Caudovirales phage]